MCIYIYIRVGIEPSISTYWYRYLALIPFFNHHMQRLNVRRSNQMVLCRFCSVGS